MRTIKRHFSKIAILVAVTGIITLAFFLSGTDMGTGKLERTISDLAGTIPELTLSADKYGGNPISGFNIRGLRLSRGKKLLASSEEVSIRIGLSSLLLGEVRISRLLLRKMRIEEDAISILRAGLPSQGRTSLPLDDIGIRDLTFVWKDRETSIATADVSLSSEALEMTFGGGLMEIPFRGDLRIQREEDAIVLDHLNLRQEKGSISLSGPLWPLTDLRGQVDQMDTERLTEALPGLKETALRGPLSSSLSILGKWPDLLIEGKLDARNCGIIGIDLSRMRALWTWQKKTVKVKDIDAEAYGSPIAGTISLDVGASSPSIEVHLTGENIDVSAWHHPFSWLKFASGKANGLSVDLKGPLDEMSGRVKFTAENLSLGSQEIRKIRGNVAVQSLRVLEIKSSGLWMESSVQASGKILLEEDPRLEIALKSENLKLKPLKGAFPSLASLQLEGAMAAGASLAGRLDSLSLKGNLSGERIRTRGELIEDVSISFVHSGNSIEISSANGRWADSVLKGSGAIRDISAPFLAFSGSIQNIGLPAIRRLLPKTGKRSFRGTIDGKWQLTGSPDESELALSIRSSDIALFGGIRVRDGKARLLVRNDRLRVVDCRGTVWGGDATMSGNIDFRKRSLSLAGEIENIDASKLTDQFVSQVPLKGIMRADLTVKGPLSKPQTILKLGSPKLQFHTLTISKVETMMTGKGHRLKLEHLRASMPGDGMFTGSGNITLPSDGHGGGMDLKAEAISLDLNALLADLPYRMAAEGDSTLSLEMKGPFGSPSVHVSSSSPKLTIGGTTISSASLMADYSNGHWNLESSGDIGKAPLHLDGDLSFEEGLWTLNFNGRATSLEASRFIHGRQEAEIPPVTGLLDISGSGTATAEGVKGSGEISARNDVRIKGLTLTDLRFPLKFDEGTIVLNGGSGSFYDGTLTAEASIDLKKENWKGKIVLSESKLSPLLADAMKLSGDISGTATLKLDLSGITGRTFLLNGTGSLEAHEGALTGFDLVRSVTKDKPLRYRAVSANFNIDGRELYILPGSRMSAYPDDEFYRYISIGGTLLGKPVDSGTARAIDLNCSGMVNLNAFNTFVGGFQKLFSSSLGRLHDPQMIARDFLTGLIGSYSARDFREVNFRLRGTTTGPEMTDLSIESPERPARPVPLPGEKDSGRDNGEVKIKVSIPTGEGSDNRPDAEEQIKQQMMENLLKQVLGGEETEED